MAHPRLQARGSFGRYPFDEIGLPTPFDRLTAIQDEEYVSLSDDMPRYDMRYFTPLAKTNTDGKYMVITSSRNDDHDLEYTPWWADPKQHLFHKNKTKHGALMKVINAIFLKKTGRVNSDLTDFMLNIMSKKYVKWTLKGIRNGQHDKPLEDIRKEAPHVQDCLVLMEPEKEISFICDDQVCIGKMVEDFLLARNKGLYTSYGLPNDHTIFEAIPDIGITNCACHLWPFGLFAIPCHNGGIRFLAKEHPQGPGDAQNDDGFALTLCLVDKEFTLEEYTTQELINWRLYEKGTWDIQAFDEHNEYVPPEFVSKNHFVFTAPVRLRCFDDDFFKPQTRQQFQFPEENSWMTNFDYVPSTVWEMKVVSYNDILKKL